MEEVYEFLKKCGSYFIATTDGDQPRVRPFGSLLIFEKKLYFQTGKVKECRETDCEKSEGRNLRYG